MVAFYYNYSLNEAIAHSPFEDKYKYYPSTLAYRLLSLVGATWDASERLTLIADIRDVVDQ